MISRIPLERKGFLLLVYVSYFRPSYIIILFFIDSIEQIKVV